MFSGHYDADVSQTAPFAAPLDPMSDPLFPLLLLLRYMHILGAILLMGGTLFMRLTLAPVVGGLPPARKTEIHEQVRVRWSKFVMLASALILISGIANLGLAARYEYKPVFGLSYHMLVGIKFLLALPIFFIASFLSGRTGVAQKFQAKAKTWMTVNLVLALIMVLLGGLLRFVHRQPKSDFQRPASSSQVADETLSLARATK